MTHVYSVQQKFEAKCFVNHSRKLIAYGFWYNVRKFFS